MQCSKKNCSIIENVREPVQDQLGQLRAVIYPNVFDMFELCNAVEWINWQCKMPSTSLLLFPFVFFFLPNFFPKIDSKYKCYIHTNTHIVFFSQRKATLRAHWFSLHYTVQNKIYTFGYILMRMCTVCTCFIISQSFAITEFISQCISMRYLVLYLIYTLIKLMLYMHIYLFFVQIST